MRAIEVDIHPWLKFRLLETQQEREVFTSFGAKKSWKKASEYLSFVSPFLGFFLAWNVCVHPLMTLQGRLSLVNLADTYLMPILFSHVGHDMLSYILGGFFSAKTIRSVPSIGNQYIPWEKEKNWDGIC